MRTTTRGPRVAAAAGAAALLLLVAGCNGSSSAKDGAGTATASSSAASPSAQATDQSTGTGQAGGLSKAQLVAALQRATRDQGSVHTEMTMSTTAGVMKASGDVAYQPAVAMRMTMDVPGAGKAEVRVVDGKLYIAMPPMTPQGKFVEIDPGDRNGPMAGQFDGLEKQMDPTQTFKAFEDGLEKVEYVGPETVDGEQLDHYVLTVRTADGLKAMGQQVPQGMPRTMTYDLWLDGDQLMRRMTMEQSGLSMDVRMSDWGEKVSVQKPARSDIITMPGQ